MTLRSLLFFWVFIVAFSVSGQSDTSPSASFRNFPLMVSVKFQNLAMPFQDLKGNFMNIGVGLGTEVSWNKSEHWTQQFNIMYFFNRGSGNGFSVYSQMLWRPALYADVLGGIKGGIGYTWLFKPNPSMKNMDGQWSPASRTKGMLSVPFGVYLSWNELDAETYLSSYLAYDVFLHSGFNADVPVIPNTFFEAGIGMYFKE
ncbi:hypothetical protein [Robertkochia flava]|uniref:hypothetical protein n=1 Tax=Robertkochia flava TaxID=3447986 RepID=UPI001CD03877|nr:hypothetical protein [Robertkochia marina]